MSCETIDTDITFEDKVFEDETNEQLRNRIYIFLYYLLTNNIKNIMSTDNKTTISASFGTTFFYRDFYEKYGDILSDIYIKKKKSKKLNEIQSYIDKYIIDHFKKYRQLDGSSFLKDVGIVNIQLISFIYSGDIIKKNEKLEKLDHPVYNQIVPYTTANIGRFLADMISYKPKYGDDQLNYVTGNNIHNTDWYSLMNDDSVGITTNIYYYIYDTYENRGFSIDSDIYTMVISPIYYPKDRDELIPILNYKKYYNPYRSDLIKVSVKYINNISYIKDAFINKGIYVFHPRLALLIQIQMPSLWQFYYNTSVKYTDINDVIVILTLQKYAATKRYMWSKNPIYAAEVYTVDPTTIANELRSIHIRFDYNGKDENTLYMDASLYGKDGYIMNEELYYNLKNVPYSIKNTDKILLSQINAELRANQRWICGKVTYKSINDSKLDEILIKSKFVLPRSKYSDTQKIEIIRRKDVQYMMNELLGIKKKCICQYKGGKSFQFETRSKKSNTKKSNTKKRIRRH